jgi:hypothetical protein
MESPTDKIILRSTCNAAIPGKCRHRLRGLAFQFRTKLRSVLID